MSYDLLLDPINTVFAVNCRVEGSTLHCGALYLEPQIQSQFIRLSDKDASLTVELPLELLHRADAARAWDTNLPITDE
jgi:hypothetical protein